MNHLLAQLRNPVLPPVLGGGTSPDYGKGGSALGSLITGLVGALFIAGFLLGFVFLILGGIAWVTSGGDKAKLEKARDQITNSLLGIIIVASAYAIAKLAAAFFGLNLNALTIPSIIGGSSTTPGAGVSAASAAQSATNSVGSLFASLGNLLSGH